MSTPSHEQSQAIPENPETTPEQVAISAFKDVGWLLGGDPSTWTLRVKSQFTTPQDPFSNTFEDAQQLQPGIVRSCEISMRDISMYAQARKKGDATIIMLETNGRRLQFERDESGRQTPSEVGASTDGFSVASINIPTQESGFERGLVWIIPSQQPNKPPKITFCIDEDTFRDSQLSDRIKTLATAACRRLIEATTPSPQI